MSLEVVSPTFTLADGLLVIDCGGGLVVARLFDRERLITGGHGQPRFPRPGRPAGHRGPQAKCIRIGSRVLRKEGTA